MRIRSLVARPILDSRGAWTVEVTLELRNGACATASVPQGKSTGATEARALPAPVAVRKINSIVAPKLKRADIRAGRGQNEQAALDALLIRLDGTGTKSNLGANAILATSIAFARASATANKIPLWGHVRGLLGPAAFPSKLAVSRGLARPRLFINVINGGLHAGNNLHFQEYLIIPKCRTIRESVEIGTQVYRALGEALARAKGKTATNLGDEGGYAPDFRDDKEPLYILRTVVQKLKLAKQIDFGIDAAATDIKKLKHKELETMYVKLLRQNNFIYLEDPFADRDFLSFAALTMRYGASGEKNGKKSSGGNDGEPVWIAGDDLTTTNIHRMERAHAEGSINAVIIKPNQIGTVSEALDAVRMARKYNWAVIASHRSGETDDDFIADFAYGVGADGLKLGAPARGERIAKYNRLLEIEAKEARP
ncbi:MAG: phosphopyruvate hydratase [Minisyncoccia bacterium]|jgi:enolase